MTASPPLSTKLVSQSIPLQNQQPENQAAATTTTNEASQDDDTAASPRPTAHDDRTATTSTMYTLPSSSHPLIAGFLGGFVSTTVLLPLDVIKVRLQVQEGEAAAVNTTTTTTTTPRAASSLQQSQSKHESLRMGTWRTLRAIVRHEGVAGLYVGWTPAVVGAAVSWGGYFYVYEQFKQSLLEYKQQRSSSPQQRVQLHSGDYFVLASAAGAVMVALTNPIWLVKTRMQLQLQNATTATDVKPYRSMGDALRTIVRDEGLAALYRGSGVAFLLTSNGGLQFVVYEALKQQFPFTQPCSSTQNKSNNNNNNTDAVSLGDRLFRSMGFMSMGAVSKIIASTATYPLQVVKARIQQRQTWHTVELTADGQVRHIVRPPYETASLPQIVARIVRQEGLGGLFKGCLPSALRVAPNAAITFVVYEATMDWLRGWNSACAP